VAVGCSDEAEPIGRWSLGAWAIGPSERSNCLNLYFSHRLNHTNRYARLGVDHSNTATSRRVAIRKHVGTARAQVVVKEADVKGETGLFMDAYMGVGAIFERSRPVLLGRIGTRLATLLLICVRASPVTWK
jgi:hypothetical protein